MKKDFQVWSGRKSDLHENKERPFFHEREVWFSSVGANIGFEQDGRGVQFLRPVIVLKKFNKEILWGVPLTRSLKKGSYYFSFDLNKETSTAILSQIRLIDSKRLQYKIGDVNESDFCNLKQKLRQLLA